MEFWNNASTGMKILIIVVIAAAVIALIYIGANAFGGGDEPSVRKAAMSGTRMPWELLGRFSQLSTSRG
jgi:ABC-type cobalt transport system substrate-binding protein